MELEKELQSQRHGTNPAAEERRRVQEVGIGRQYVTLRCRSGGYTGCAEDISVAEGIARVIEDVECIGFRLEVGSFRKMKVLGKRHIKNAKARGRHAIPSHCSEGARTCYDVPRAGIHWGVADRWEEGVAGGITWVEAGAARGNAGGFVERSWAAIGESGHSAGKFTNGIDI